MSWSASFEDLIGSWVLAEGQHVVVVDNCETPLGPFVLAFCVARLAGPVHVVALAESVLHYQTVCRKMGVSVAGVVWHTAIEDVPAGAERVVVDSLFALQCAGGPMAVVVHQVRALRRRLGSRGVLVSGGVHEDCLEPAWLAYEADVVLALRRGRVCVTARGQRHMSEVSVRDLATANPTFSPV